MIGLSQADAGMDSDYLTLLRYTSGYLTFWLYASLGTQQMGLQTNCFCSFPMAHQTKAKTAFRDLKMASGSLKNWLKVGNNNVTSTTDSQKRKMSEEGKDAAKIFGTLESEGSDFEPEGEEVKKVQKAQEKKKAEPKSKKRRGGKIDGLTVEQHRRVMGDQVKSKLRVLGGSGNYGIAASCHVSMSCSIEVFRSLVVPNASKVTPAQFDSSTPVVLVQVDSTQQVV